jgi:hypothetical protein
MKEFCGYEASDGSLWKTKEECENQEVKIKLRKVHNKFRDLEIKISRFVHKAYRDTREAYQAPVTESQAKEIIRDCLIDILTLGKKQLLELYEEGNKYSAELDKLESQLQGLQKPWYLKLKWWK